MKTGVKYTSVVFPEGVAVLRKYNNQLPSITNQKGNAYLKEIQTICGISKTLHFHLFRKTYGTRLLNRGGETGDGQQMPRPQQYPDNVHHLRQAP